MSNKELVFNIIKKSSKHLTAYEILDKLQKIKKTQPMTVYRALDSLIDEERIHKSNQTKTLVVPSDITKALGTIELFLDTIKKEDKTDD